MKIGPYECHTVETARMRIKGMFGDVPSGRWAREFPPDGDGRSEFAVRSLLIRGEGQAVLVDAGCGTRLSEKLMHEYGVDASQHELMRSLAALGVSPGDVSHVVLTHLHFDHCGGAIERDGSGKLIPVFPNAACFIQQRHMAAALDPEPEEAESFLEEDLRGIGALSGLEFLDGPAEILPGIQLRTADGHTTDQQYVVVTGGAHTLVFPSDVLPTAAHLRVPWFTAFDMRPRRAVEEKKGLIEEAAAGGWVIVYDHEPRFAASAVRTTELGFEPGITWKFL